MSEELGASAVSETAGVEQNDSEGWWERGPVSWLLGAWVAIRSLITFLKWILEAIVWIARSPRRTIALLRREWAAGRARKRHARERSRRRDVGGLD